MVDYDINILNISNYSESMIFIDLLYSNIYPAFQSPNQGDGFKRHSEW